MSKQQGPQGPPGPKGDKGDQGTPGSANAWGLTGTVGTSAANFVGTLDNQPLNLRVNNSRALRLEPAFNAAAPAPNVIGGSPDNQVSAGVHSATIAGGGRQVPGSPATANRVTNNIGTVAGGSNNSTSGLGGTIGGGRNNQAIGSDATVGGGLANTATAPQSTVGGGNGNIASGGFAFVGGGQSNTVAGDFSFAAGRRAKNVEGTHRGVFLFGDSTDADFESVAANEFAVRASGGFRFRTAANLSTGCNLPANSGMFACTSDARTKRDFEAISPTDVLRGVAELPIAKWRFAAEEPSIRHLGPTAQDFRSAFGLGSDDTSIGLPDANGVALAAIKGLDEKLEGMRREGGSARGGSAAPLPLAALVAAGVLGLLLAAALGSVITLRVAGRRFASAA